MHVQANLSITQSGIYNSKICSLFLDTSILIKYDVLLENIKALEHCTKVSFLQILAGNRVNKIKPEAHVSLALGHSRFCTQLIRKERDGG